MTHREIQSALDGIDVAVDAAEAHGILCGALCVRQAYDARAWIADLAEDAGAPAPDNALPEALLAAHEETLDALRSTDFSFSPALPDDETLLSDRVAALAAWCDGFLYGIGSGASGGEIVKEADIGEFLRDLTDIARAELEPGRSAEAAEGDYAELVEFVRAGAQLTFDELLRTTANAAG
ncbi:MAG TPA: UPF0149 family protein [Steroidobacteraceae bacterium]